MAKLPAMQNQYVEFAKNDSEGRNLAETLTELENKPSGTKLYKHKVTYSKGLYYYVELITDSPNEITNPNLDNNRTFGDIKIYIGTNYPSYQGSVSGQSLKGVKDFGRGSGNKDYLSFIKFYYAGNVYLTIGNFNITDNTYAETTTEFGSITSDTVTPL